MKDLTKEDLELLAQDDARRKRAAEYADKWRKLHPDKVEAIKRKQKEKRERAKEIRAMLRDPNSDPLKGPVISIEGCPFTANELMIELDKLEAAKLAARQSAGTPQVLETGTSIPPQV